MLIDFLQEFRFLFAMLREVSTEVKEQFDDGEEATCKNRAATTGDSRQTRGLRQG